MSSLIHAIDHFRRPRTESVLTTPELAAIAIPTMFIWGTDAPYLSAERARPSIDQIPTATLHEAPGGHGPWLVDAERSAELIQRHLTSIGPQHDHNHGGARETMLADGQHQRDISERVA